jgi:septal ring factor EnvC (AmiA/AmiB activator)
MATTKDRARKIASVLTDVAEIQRQAEQIERQRRQIDALNVERLRLAALLFPKRASCTISWDDLAMGLADHVAESDYDDLVKYVGDVCHEEGLSIAPTATTKAKVEALQDELREQRERADDAEKERDAAQAKIEEIRGDVVELLKALDFDVMPLLPVGSWQDAPSFDDPLVVDRLRAQRAS